MAQKPMSVRGQWEDFLDKQKAEREDFQRMKRGREVKAESTAPRKAPRLKYQSTKRTLKHLPERRVPSGKMETVSTAPEKAPQIKSENARRTLKNLPERSVRSGYAEVESSAPRKAPQLKGRRLRTLRNLPQRAIGAVKNYGKRLAGTKRA